MDAAGHDAIVIGGGHNGLACAAYLARAGLRPLVLERRGVVGGAAVTEEPWPGFRVSTLSYVMSLMPPRIVRELELPRHGYRVHRIGPYFAAFRDGTALTLWYDDPARLHEELARFSRRDADAYSKYQDWLARVAAILRPLLFTTPPRLGSRSLPDLLDQLCFAWKLRGVGPRGVADLTRVFTMSAADLLDDWFESEKVKTLLSIDGIIGTWAGPYDPGTAYVMLHHEIGGVEEGDVGGWGFVEGGMGAVSAAIARAVEARGGTVRTSAPVARILVEADRAVGVALESGEEIRAPVVVSAAHPQLTFLRLLDPDELPDDFVADIRGWETRSGTVKVNLALSALPDFTAAPGPDRPWLAGAIELAESRGALQRAFEEARAGRASEHPYADCVIPTTLDRTIAPDGMHILSCFAQWVPQEWAAEPHEAELEAFADRLIDDLTALAPNLRGSIVHRQVIGPYTMEREYGLDGGNIFHGELSFHQLFHMRPAPGHADYRTPLRGLYQCGSGTHPGGGVTGIPGRNAAREILRDRKRGRGRG